jgi:hypothetical protein
MYKTSSTTLPTLIEPGVRYFIGGTLKECCKFKDRHISTIFNVSVTIFFIVFVSGLLLYRYKGKLTPTEIALKNREKQEYIVSKLQQINIHRKSQQQKQNMITNLPTWD